MSFQSRITASPVTRTLTLFTPMSMTSAFTTVRCCLVGGPPKCQRLRVASARKRVSPAPGLCLSAKNLLDPQVAIRLLDARTSGIVLAIFIFDERNKHDAARSFIEGIQSEG